MNWHPQRLQVFRIEWQILSLLRLVDWIVLRNHLQALNHYELMTYCNLHLELIHSEVPKAEFFPVRLRVLFSSQGVHEGSSRDPTSILVSQFRLLSSLYFLKWEKPKHILHLNTYFQPLRSKFGDQHIRKNIRILLQYHIFSIRLQDQLSLRLCC